MNDSIKFSFYELCIIQDSLKEQKRCLSETLNQNGMEEEDYNESIDYIDKILSKVELLKTEVKKGKE